MLLFGILIHQYLILRLSIGRQGLVVDNQGKANLIYIHSTDVKLNYETT